jgi:anti-sigma B factor antagonist
MYGCGPTRGAVPRSVRARYPISKGAHLDLYIQKDQLNDGNGVTISGEMDMSNAGILTDFLTAEIESTGGDLYLNLAGLDFIDSTGLAALLGARRQLAVGGRSLILSSPSPAVARVLEVTGLDALFDTETAGAYVQAPIQRSA